MRNIALKLRYDGSAYHGWQVQKFDVSVAATVERRSPRSAATRSGSLAADVRTSESTR